jgi:hypothetical protein
MNKIDLDELSKFYNNSTESIIEIFEVFLNDYEKIYSDFSTSFKFHDLNALKGYLHHHAPMFSYIGLPEITAAFQHLEKQCVVNADPESIRAEFENAIHLLQDAKTQVVEKKSELIQIMES